MPRNQVGGQSCTRNGYTTHRVGKQPLANPVDSLAPVMEPGKAAGVGDSLAPVMEPGKAADAAEDADADAAEDADAVAELGEAVVLAAAAVVLAVVELGKAVVLAAAD